MIPSFRPFDFAAWSIVQGSVLSVVIFSRLVVVCLTQGFDPAAICCLQPMAYSRRLNKPLLIITITDGTLFSDQQAVQEKNLASMSHAGCRYESDDPV